MDFFEAQERARRRTHRLVFLFILAVAGTVLVGYASVMLGLHYREHFNSRNSRYRSETPPLTIANAWDPKIFLWTAGGTLTVILLASLYKWNQMRAGGAAIAEMVGGRAVDPHTTDFLERRLLNVVEEMSIASGIPVPAVYLLEHEPGLNAFAAGLTTSDAAIAVTRGTLDKLNREELQGVIGHEFSHILNGDMRLNVRITSIVFGILVIGLIGRGFLQAISRGRVRSCGNKKDSGVMFFLAIGVVLMIIGYVGYFFGRMIQAAVSRQREFLADASAVQFTRNAGSVAGALKKIGGYFLGGTVINAHAGEIGHFFYAQAFKSSFGGLWATHPPLGERIKAVEPTWDGAMFEPPEVVDIAHESFATAGLGSQRFTTGETVQRVFQAIPDLPPPLLPARLPFTPATVVADVGALTESHFRHAQALLTNIPAQLREASRSATSAQALVCGLLLNGDKPARDAQQALVEKFAGAEISASLQSLRPSLSILDPTARLPLLQLAVPALRQLDATALNHFAATLDELVHSDRTVAPFEFALQKMLLTQLRLAQAPTQRVQFDSFGAVNGEIAIVLSALARVGHQNGVAVATAFLAGAAQLPVLATQLALLAPTASGLEQVDTALDKLAACSLVIKQRLLVAAGHVIAHDGTVTLEEGELYRAFAATLAVPMPTLGKSV